MTERWQIDDFCVSLHRLCVVGLTLVNSGPSSSDPESQIIWPEKREHFLYLKIQKVNFNPISIRIQSSVEFSALMRIQPVYISRGRFCSEQTGSNNKPSLCIMGRVMGGVRGQCGKTWRGWSDGCAVTSVVEAIKFMAFYKSYASTNGLLVLNSYSLYFSSLNSFFSCTDAAFS